MNIILFDDLQTRLQLLPFTFTRPVSAIRVGILTIEEKWEHYSGTQVSHLTEDYLADKFPMIISDPNYLVDGSIFPDQLLMEAILALKPGQLLLQKGKMLAQCIDRAALLTFDAKPVAPENRIEYPHSYTCIQQIWDIFRLNGEALRKDFDFLTRQRKSYAITDPYTRVYNPEQVFLEEGVKIKSAVLNAENGPIYIGKNAEIQEGSLIRGPFYLGEGSVLNMGSKIRPDTSIGPFCKVGGEVSNSVFLGYSNKSHDGFLGNSVIGEWCNLGADTNTSNLKNNYSEVKIWSYAENKMIGTGLQFCGLFMGDYSKAGINTMFNTGTVVGVSCNIFGGGFPPKFIPSFTWGGSEGNQVFEINKAIEVGARTYDRRKMQFDAASQKILQYLHDLPKERLVVNES